MQKGLKLPNGDGIHEELGMGEQYPGEHGMHLNSSIFSYPDAHTHESLNLIGNMILFVVVWFCGHDLHVMSS